MIREGATPDARRRRAGAQLIQWRDHGGENQQWVVKRYAKGFAIGSRASNLVVTVAGGSKESGAKVVQAVHAASSAQLWRFEAVNGE